MFGDEKTLPCVNNILAKQQEERNGINVDISSGVDMSLKYMIQLYSDTLDTMTGRTDAGNSVNNNTNEIAYNVNEENKAVDISAEDQIEMVDNQDNPFLHLPIQVHLHILSFLEASDICLLSATCQQCLSICSDELLWRDVLNKEKTSWTEVSHVSNPALYDDVNSDLSNKEIYMRCNPCCARDHHFNILSIPRLIWSYLPQKPPKVAMFGPGLDSSTSGIVRKLISDETEIFKVHGVFPADHPGVGTGFNISMNNKAHLRLITLYSGTKRDRTNGNAQTASRADRNKLLRRVPSSIGSTDSDTDEEVLKYEPTPSIRALCDSIDAFIFVVDASMPIETIQEGCPELFAMLNERWTPSKAPLLVLSCIPDTQLNRVPCVAIAEQLVMHRLNRIWKMFDADVSSLSGVVKGITWLMDNMHRR